MTARATLCNVTPSPAAVALLGFGQVRHTRLKPVRNAFAYGT
jgi:DUF1365 family protein